jgi:hypothetical protein
MARDMDWEMTDAERRKELLDELRSAAFYRGPEFSVCDKAADEIERLAALPQPDAETESYGDQLRRVMKRQTMQSIAEPPKGVRDAWQHYYHEAPADFDPVAENIFEAGWKAALTQSDAELGTYPGGKLRPNGM